MTWFEVSSRRTAGARSAGAATAIGRRRQHVVLDRDKGGGVLGDIAIAADDDRDGLADEGHLAVRQSERPAAVEPRSRIRGADHAPLLHDRRQIVQREHGGNARHRARGAQIDAADQRVRVRTARERRMQHAGGRNVVDETSAPAQQRMILKARNSRSDQFAHGPCHSLEIAFVALARTSFGVA